MSSCIFVGVTRTYSLKQVTQKLCRVISYFINQCLSKALLKHDLGLTSWLSFVVSSVSLSLSHWYPGSGVVLDCIDS